MNTDVSVSEIMKQVQTAIQISANEEAKALTGTLILFLPAEVKKVNGEEIVTLSPFFQSQDFLEFDLILAMDHENLFNIQMLLKQTQTAYAAHQIRAKIALMSEYDQTYPKQALPDPYYGGANGFERVLDQCESSSLAWVSIFKQQFKQQIDVK